MSYSYCSGYDAVVCDKCNKYLNASRIVDHTYIIDIEAKAAGWQKYERARISPGHYCSGCLVEAKNVLGANGRRAWCDICDVEVKISGPPGREVYQPQCKCQPGPNDNKAVVRRRSYWRCEYLLDDEMWMMGDISHVSGDDAILRTKKWATSSRIIKFRPVEVTEIHTVPIDLLTKGDTCLPREH